MVVVGDKAGFRMPALLTPVVGVQLKLVPSLVRLGVKDAPLQIVVSGLLLNTGLAKTLIVKERTIVQEPVDAVKV